jgi:glutamate formiminotransferase
VVFLNQRVKFVSWSVEFMQRSKEAELRAKECQAREASLKESQWVFDIANSAVLIEEAPNVDPTVCGRRSFLNFNKDIEVHSICEVTMK